MMTPGMALTDPTGQGALLQAANWVRSLLLGTPAVAIATIAIAGIGFLMLQGRLPIRRALIAVLGCFIIFGSTSIARGLLAIEAIVVDPAPPPASVPGPVSTPMAPPPQPTVYDPYAGASVPIR